MKTTTNPVRINYRDEGAGLPIIFLHAFPLNLTMWDEQVDDIKLAHRAIALNLRGFGESTTAPNALTMDDYADDVKSLMVSLDLKQAVIVGLSMGGYIAQAFLKKYPDALRALVLADTRATADSEDARQRRLISASKAERDGAAAIADDMISVLLGETSLQSRPQVVARVREMINSNAPSGIAAAQRAMAARPDSTEALSRTELPILIVVGDEDKITNLEEANSLRSLVPHAHFSVIKAAGHLSNLEAPSKFNATLMHFFSTLH